MTDGQAFLSAGIVVAVSLAAGICEDVAKLKIGALLFSFIAQRLQSFGVLPSIFAIWGQIIATKTRKWNCKGGTIQNGLPNFRTLMRP